MISFSFLKIADAHIIMSNVDTWGLVPSYPEALTPTLIFF
jgi:hypothetical protein